MQARIKKQYLLKTEASSILLHRESYSHEQNTARMADFLQIISRKNASKNLEYLPVWTGFNTQIHEETRSPSTIGHLPVIDAPVTKMATVNTLLKHSVPICDRLNLPEIVLVFDEANYAKAQSIRNLSIYLSIYELFLLILWRIRHSVYYIVMRMPFLKRNLFWRSNY